MNPLKRLLKYCPRPESPMSTLLRQHSKPVAVFLTATVLAASFFLFYLSLLSHPMVPPEIEVINPTPETSAPEFTPSQSQNNSTLPASAPSIEAKITGSAVLPITPTIPEGRAYTVTNYNAYNANSITLYFLVDHDDNYKGAPVSTAWYSYSLDGQTNVTFTPSYKTIEYHYYSNGGKSVTEINGVNLHDLTEGVHSIVIYAKLNQLIAGMIMPIDVGSTVGVSNIKLFTIDTTLPSVVILAPTNRIYDTSEVPLNFNVNEPCPQITYSLNGRPNVTITGNGTFTLAWGEYNLTMCANDVAGNIGASETVSFTLAQTQETKSVTQPSEPFPVTLTAAVLITAVAGVSLLAYFVKVKKTSKRT